MGNLQSSKVGDAGHSSRRRIAFQLSTALLALCLVGACGGSGAGPEGAPQATAPERLAVGPHVTCVTGPRPLCAGENTFQVPADLEVLDGEAAPSFGVRHGCVIDEAGLPACWGDASEGQLGVRGTAVDEERRGRASRSTPAPVVDAPQLTALDAGWLHTCGIDGQGSVFCWGSDSLDQLGRAGEGPGVAAVEGLPGRATAVSAGGVHTCALLADGGVYCWGDGSMGQLGRGELVDAGVPVAVAGLEGRAVELSAGAYHTCARLENGGVACWGDNRFGQLGDGTRERSGSPVAVAGLAGRAVAAVAGFSFSCALLETGQVQCWGSNELGELGTGRLERPADPLPPPAGPTLVDGLPGKVTELVAAGNHACAAVAGSGFYCWGSNESGQLGDGTVETRDRPIPWRGLQADLPRPQLSLGDAAGTPPQGLDVSYHSGRVDWRAAATRGDRFALTLATAGDDFCDPFFFAHWEGIRQAGLVRGAYHFFIAEDDPEEQARHFLAYVTFEPGDLAPVVDIETRKQPVADLPDRLRRFLAVVEEEVGTRPIIYTGPSFWESNMSDGFGDYPLWIAEYGVEEPTVPRGWRRWHLWQWRGDAELPEIAPIVDLNRLHPDVDLRELLIH